MRAGRQHAVSLQVGARPRSGQDSHYDRGRWPLREVPSVPRRLSGSWLRGLAGLADRREDNGERKITPVYERELLNLVERLPQEFGYRRPTWTQELFILVLAEQVEISISVSAMSRLLGRSGIQLRRLRSRSLAALGRRHVGHVDCGRFSDWSRIFPPTKSCCMSMKWTSTSNPTTDRTGPKH